VREIGEKNFISKKEIKFFFANKIFVSDYKIIKIFETEKWFCWLCLSCPAVLDIINKVGLHE
jgi:hypothetical protein